MRKARLIALIAGRTGIVGHQIKHILEIALETIKEQAFEGETIMLRRFGSFYSRPPQKTQFIHPKTKKLCQVKIKRILVFRPARNLATKNPKVGNG